MTRWRAPAASAIADRDRVIVFAATLRGERAPHDRVIANADCRGFRGLLTSDAAVALELVLPDHTRLALVDVVTIGRAPESTLRLTDPSVSRVHARIFRGDDGAAMLEDAGSSYGTWLDGHRLGAPAEVRAGSRIRVGNHELLVDRRRGEDEAGPTIVVPATTSAPTSRPRTPPRAATTPRRTPRSG